MSEIKHTPGPWSYFVPFKGRYPIVQRGRSGGFQVIAVNKDSALADARLIAAAPELLEVLRHCKEVLTIVNGVDRDLMTKEALERVSLAITKAEGGE